MEERDRQLFILPPDIVGALTIADVMHTARQMHELNICKPPVRKFDIRLIGSLDKIAQWLYDAETEEMKKLIEKTKEKNLPHNINYRYDFEKDSNHYSFKTGITYLGEKEIYFYTPKENFELKKRQIMEVLSRNFEYEEFFRSEVSTASKVLATLIVVLATKNIKKSTIEFKQPNESSRKKPKKYRYITTIDIGQITENYESKSGSHSSPRPHLRRGHIRTQHFGEGNKEIKKIFIQPVFVNADDGWIANERRAYKITL